MFAFKARYLFHSFLLGAAMAMLTPPLVAKSTASPVTPLDKISRSFSDDKMGRSTIPKGGQLMHLELNHPDCTPANLSDCYVRDVNGLQLYFSPYDGLNSKQISISPRYTGAVKALKIGTARSRKAVMAVMEKYWRFFPNQKFLCEHFEQKPGVKSKDLTCAADIGATEDQDRPVIVLTFNENDRIITAAVQASIYISIKEASLMRKSLSSLLFIMLNTSAANANAPINKKNLQLYQKVSADMSRYSFDLKQTDAKKIKQKGVVYSEKPDDGIAVLTDENGVEHDFYDGMWRKTMKPKPAAFLKVAGIGKARDQKTIRAAFKKYSQGKELVCYYKTESESSYVKENPKKLGFADFCNFAFNIKSEERLILDFDAKGNLAEITLQDWFPF